MTKSLKLQSPLIAEILSSSTKERLHSLRGIIWLFQYLQILYVKATWGATSIIQLLNICDIYVVC